MTEIPTYNHEFEFQEALKRILEKKNHVEKVVIKRLGADLEVYHDGAFKNLHPRNVHIKLSNPFFIEAKILGESQRNVYRGIKQAYDKYSHRSEDKENKTVFLVTPESFFGSLEEYDCGYRFNLEPVYFPDDPYDEKSHRRNWCFRFNRICWTFQVGIIGQLNPTLFALNDLDRFYLEDKV